MISSEQIRVIAREQERAVGVVEKDYALTWLLKGLYSKNSFFKDSFVFKGGTAIRKVYYPETWRFSEDLDFTVVGKNQADRIRESLQKVFDFLLQESGFSYSLESFHPTAGSIIANVQFLGPLNHTNRIKHDITLKEKLVLTPIQKTVSSFYPDISKFKILVYRLEEILTEKIRSIMQRGYSRDYYDVWRLFKENKFRKAQIKKLLIQKCTLNEIEYDPKLLFSRRRLEAARSFWKTGLEYLTKELPEFEFVMADLKQQLAFLTS